MTNTEAIERLTYIKEHQIDPEDYEVIDFAIKALSKKKTKTAFAPPTIEELQDYINAMNFNVDTQRFIDYYEANGWYAGRVKMKDWKATVRNWDRRDKERRTTQKPRQVVINKEPNVFGKMFLEE